MTTPLQVLIVEDSEIDTQLVLRQLRRHGFDPTHERVQSADEMRAALTCQSWDLILSDYVMPQFDAPAALEILYQSGQDIPFIVVSGSIGEDIAVQMMKAGAHDYLLKNNLNRFVPAIQRELREAEGRRARRKAEEEKRGLEAERVKLLERLRQENEDLADLTKVTANAISTLDLDELLTTLLSRIVEVMKADAAVILLVENGILRSHAMVGISKPEAAPHEVPVGRGFSGAVAATLQPLYIADAQTDLQVQNTWLKQSGVRSLLGVPLKRNGRLVGVLHVDWLAIHPYREREVHLLEITAERCAAAIVNAQLYEATKRSEQALRKVTTAIHHSADSVVITDRQGVIEYVNPAFERQSGYSKEEALGQTPRIVKSGAHDPAFYQLFWKTILDGQIFRGIFVNRKKNGELYYEEHTVTPLRDENGTITHFIATGRDITERRRSEEELKAAEERYRNLVELSPDGIVIESEGRLVFANKAATELFGAADPAQIVGRPVIDLVHPDDRPTVLERIKNLRESGANAPPKEAKLLRMNGTVFEAEVAAAPYVYHGQLASIAVIRDISEKKQLAARLLRSQRLESIGTLAGGIAHDLNNVLAPIMMSLEILQLKFTDEEGRKILATVSSSAQRGAELVKQVLTFSRGLQGDRMSVQLRHVVREMQAIIRQTFPKSISLQSQMPRDLWTVMGDATQLHQVLMNLCVNARDAMPCGGTLTLQGENLMVDETFASMTPHARSGPYLVLTVADTGTGIPVEIREQVFEPCQRLGFRNERARSTGAQRERLLEEALHRGDTGANGERDAEGLV